MSELPRRLTAGTSLTANWLNRLLDWCRGRELMAGPGIRLSHTPSGTTISAPGSDEATPKPMPLDCKFGGNKKLLCHVPNHSSGLVRIGYAAIKFDGKKPNNDWVEVGDFGPGDKLTLFVLFDQSAQTTAAKLATAKWRLSKEAAPPSGKESGAPPVLVAEYVSGVGLLQRFHGPYWTAAPDETLLDTDEHPGNPPGESINRFASSATNFRGRQGHIQLRQFHDANDKESVQPLGSTGEGTTVENLQILMRRVTSGTADVRPTLVYVDGATGPFWVKGGDAGQNFGTSIKLGDDQIGYVTISVTQ